MKKILIALFVGFSIMLSFNTQAAAIDPLCSKYGPGGNCIKGPCAEAPNSAACQQSRSQQAKADNPNPVADTLLKVANIMALLTGIVAVLMVIISGLRFITSGGNPEATKKARANLIAAIIGLIVVAVSWTLVTFIVQKFVQ